jgi:predicted nucleic acid-binding Zn ribbon protein
MRRGGKINRLGIDMERVLGGREMLRKLKEHTAPIVWAEVVGEQLAAATEVLGVSGGVLRVSAKSSVWANELTFYKTDILKRLNAKLGAPRAYVITDIHFQSRGVKKSADESKTREPEVEIDSIELSVRERQQIEESIYMIKDPDLRERLRKTRFSEVRLRNWRLDNGWAPCLHCGELVAPFLGGNGMSCPRCRLLGDRG